MLELSIILSLSFIPFVSKYNLRAIVKDVPEAIYCQSYLLTAGACKPSQQSPLSTSSKTRSSPSNVELSKDFIGTFSEASRIWAEAKQLQAKKQYMDAAKMLDNQLNGLNLRYILFVEFH